MFTFGVWIKVIALGTLSILVIVLSVLGITNKIKVDPNACYVGILISIILLGVACYNGIKATNPNY